MTGFNCNLSLSNQGCCGVKYLEIFDNINKFVKDDLAITIGKGSRLSIAAACFSIYAYQVLKDRLDSVEELRFIFTSPAFVKEKAPREKREFYIPRLNRERSLYGTEFEIKLRNELSQKAIARECAEWVRKKVTFRSNTTHDNMGGFLNIESNGGKYTYMPLGGFTTVDIGCERGNNSYNMRKYSTLLGDAITSIIEVKDQNEIESFLNGDNISFLTNKIKGLDDFELICFLVVR